MTLRTGKLDVLAAELVGPGEEGWDDVLAVFTRALVDERRGAWPSGRKPFDTLANGLVPVVTSNWLVHEPGHGLMWWSATEVAKRLPETRQPDAPPLRWNYVTGEWVPREDTPVAVCMDESVSTGPAAPTHWNFYANGEYVVTAPVKKPKSPKRCMWVWGDEDGLHQCDRPRSEPHTHTERGAVLFHPRWEGEPRCLGVQLGGRVGEPLELVQCESLRYACKVTHPFYAKTRMDEDGPAKPKLGAQRCPWVWNDTAGWHQCGRRRGDHGHDEAPGFYVELETEGEPRCLGLWTLERQPGEVQVLQCPLLGSDCESYHPFYAKRGFKEQT